MSDNERPFDTIEDTQAFLAILSDKIDEIVAEARRELTVRRFERRHVQAWQVVIYKATKLSSHVASSRKIMSDLLTVRNVLDGIAGVNDTEAEPANSAFIPEDAPAAPVRRHELCVA